MTFINRYTAQQNRNYYDSREFTENGTPFIISVGQIGHNGLITSINSLTGDIIWEKAYVFSGLGTPQIIFHKIVRAGFDDIMSKAAVSSYFIYATNGISQNLLNINIETGTVNWCKEIGSGSDLTIWLEPVTGTSSAYVAVSSQKKIEVLLMSGAGVEINAVDLNITNHEITAFRSIPDGIMVAISGTGEYLLKLNTDLSYNTAYNIRLPDSVIEDICQNSANDFDLTGCRDSGTREAFRLKCTLGAQAWEITELNSLSNAHAKNLRIGNNLYLLEYNSVQSLFHKFSVSETLEWTKEINIDGFTGGITNFTTSPENGFINFIISENNSGEVIAHVNSELQSCKTVNAVSPQLKTDKVFVTPWLFNFLTIKNNFTNIKVRSSDIISIKEELCPSGDGSVDMDENTSLQSPDFYIQTAGSQGTDSTKGIHTRWIFRGVLGEKHLPKGNLTNQYVNFNKEDDFVKLYRTPYFKVQATLDFSVSPNLVDNANKIWIYKQNNGERIFYVYFKNQERYNTVRQAIDPMTNPQLFIKQYGGNLIEIENKKELFFAGDVELNEFLVGDKFQMEGLFVSENTLVSPKKVYFRKIYTRGESDKISWQMENGRSIRFRGLLGYVTKIHFEFYADFISAVNVNSGWTALDRFSLSLTDSTVFSLLEPTENLVNGRWLRYNNDAYVNINNYKDKWGRTVIAPDRNLKQMVERYIDLSNNPNNPKAEEQISLIHEDGEVQPGDSPDDMIIISLLDLLRISSYDYHIARMLGLGALDYHEEVWTGTYIYLAEYITFGDLEDGEGARKVQHLSMSLPTSIHNHRLPIPVELEKILPGVFVGNDSPEPTSMTDSDGYTFDGKQRFVSLFSKYFENDAVYPPFFQTLDEFDKSLFTYPVYAGVEYRKKILGGADPGVWEKPEISHDTDYLNIDTEPNSFETLPILVPDAPRPLYVHYHSISGTHFYNTYGINWFSRAGELAVEFQIETLLVPKNPLMPPYGINPFLIVAESPLLFTSQEEQIRLNEISGQQDKTLVRIPFFYDAANEILDYKVPDEVANPLDPLSIFPDEEEIMAKKAEIFFKNSVPLGISGKATAVYDHPGNPLVSVIETDKYLYLSTGEEIYPVIPPELQSNFIGGLFVMGSMSYIIHEISSDSSGINPTFTVFKKEISDGIILDTIPVVDTGNLLSPVIEGDGLFHTAENMQNAYCWNQGQPMPFKIKIDDERNDFVIHRELIYKINDKGEMEEHLEKTRGFWKPATIEEVEEVIDVIEHEQENGEIEYEEVEGFNGLYKIIFNDFKLTQHSQYSTTENSAEWFNGAVRLFTEDSFNSSGKPIKSRKQLKVVRTENIGSNQNLIIYCEDPDYNILDPDFNEAEYDKIKTGNNLRVNYYPGYKVYLYANQPYNLDSNGISPDEGEGIKYSVFGLRSVDNVHQINNENYKSRISTPALMFVMENIEAQTPEQPKGALYATRPDYFGRSTYTFTTKYSHKPHGLLICRSNDELLLNSLYKPETINLVRAELESRGGQEEIYFTNRWQNFLNFGLLKTEGNYAAYPPEEIEDEPLPYRFPLPDNKKFYDEINQYIKWHNTKYGTSIALIPEASVGNILLDVTLIPNLFNQTGNDKKLIDFVEEAVYYSFVPLTEMPVIYQYVFGNDYQPKDEKQVIKDKDGYPLPPNDGNFKMAPMMKILSSLPHKTLFTDFHLDGYSRNFYFYGVREVSSRMKLGEFSKFLGPVKLVNSNPPEAPEIKRIMPVLENPVLGILPHIQLEINAYPKIQNIRKVSVYRTFDRLKAQSVQFMDLVETIDLEDEELLEEDIWTVYDYFGDLPEIRYGDGIYYRLTVSRKIEYAKADYAYDDEENEEPEIVIEYAPSQASKITASLISEVKIPDAPVLEFTSGILDPETLDNVVLKWSKQVYNGKYYLYKMNRQGNWVKIKFIQTNEPEIEVALEDTDLESGQLVIKDNEGNPVYHHFKVVVENTAGMQSTEENILTIGNI